MFAARWRMASLLEGVVGCFRKDPAALVYLPKITHSAKPRTRSGDAMAVLPEEFQCPHCGLVIPGSDATACGHCGGDVSFVQGTAPEGGHYGVTPHLTDPLFPAEHIEGGKVAADQAVLHTNTTTAAASVKRDPKQTFNLIKNIVALPVFWFATQFGVDYLGRCCGQAAESMTTGVVAFMALVGWAFFVIVT
jgi:hypothetical protein